MKRNMKPMKKLLRIGILGSRGVPARYGGFERVAEDLSLELAKKGYQVFVTCERSVTQYFKNPFYIKYENIYLIYFPIIDSLRVIFTLLYDILSILWASFKVDLIYLLGYSSVLGLIFPKLLKRSTMINVDGLEWKRRKFNSIIRFYLRICEILSAKIPKYIIVDSKVIGNYYIKNYNITPHYIPNGLKQIIPLSSDSLKDYKLEPYGYYLVVARLEPENNVDYIIDSFKRCPTSRKLVIVGPLKNTNYVKNILNKSSSDKRIIFLGGIYNKERLTTLRFFSACYIHGHEVGGANPSLIEALACGNLILALDTPFNREVAKKAAIYFKKEKEDLVRKLEFIEKNLIKLSYKRKESYEIYKREYTIDKMVNTFEKIILKEIKKSI